MKLAVALSIFSSLCWGSLGIDVPSGINKCVLKYPEVYKCVADEANRLIPEIVKGNEALGIPSLSPVRIPRGDLRTADLDLIATDVVFDNFKDFKVADVYFHFIYRNASILFQADFLNMTSNYEINKGKLLSRNIWGNGRFDLSLVGNSVRYTGTINYRDVNKDIYVEMKKANVVLETQRAHFRFENLKSSVGGVELNDTEEFVSENWRTLLDLLRPKFERFILTAIKTVFGEVHQKIPVQKLFVYE